MKTTSLIFFGALTMVACGGDKTPPPVAPPSTPADTTSAMPGAASPSADPVGQPQGVPEGATPPPGQKLCSCTLSSLEACSPKCKPHRWFAVDCQTQRPKACLKD